MTLPFNPFQEAASIAARHVEGDGEVFTAIENLVLSRRSVPTAPLYMDYRPCVCFVLQGNKVVKLGDDVIHYGVGDYLLTSMELPVTSRVTVASPDAPHLCFALAIDMKGLSSLLQRIDLPRPLPDTDVSRGIVCNVAPPELLDATTRLLRLLDRPADIPAMAPLIEQEILYRVLSGPDGGRFLHIATSESRSNRIAKAICWLRANYHRTLRIEDLAEHVGMSASSLHHHFKTVTAMTPVQFQKKLRLHEARRLMLLEGLDVGSAGHRVGYQSPSQFSREYSRFYGASPLRDVGAMLDVAAE
ncbi:AraC family transcriptional regulator [Rhizobium sp. XQZ8]|uniref:AraC family transcriptional regulator n=1 Tax=Rhizobium populisoli TaxID=2859785 RepID=UPI001C6697C1|nr:AraC family transcriptional regulator [Rhizobium populisoli]MBW6422629.1 AraC family transcriptional regulator [Rhizobium populisoli]